MAMTTSSTCKGLPPALYYGGHSKGNYTEKAFFDSSKSGFVNLKKKKNVPHHLLDNFHYHQKQQDEERALLLILKLIEICCSLESIHKIHESHLDRRQLPHLKKGPPINRQIA